MAKLTGTALPPLPLNILFPSFETLAAPAQGGGAGVMPTLEELQQRARAKLVAAQQAGASLVRNNTVTSPSTPLAPGDPDGLALKRNKTVTGVGGGGEGLLVAPIDRDKIRVNLMRKLSARRLEGPSRARAAEGLDVVGRIGRARPRSGSWSAGGSNGGLGGVEPEQVRGGLAPPLAFGEPFLGAVAQEERHRLDELDTQEVVRDSQLTPLDRTPRLDGPTGQTPERTPQASYLNSWQSQPPSDEGDLATPSAQHSSTFQPVSYPTYRSTPSSSTDSTTSASSTDSSALRAAHHASARPAFLPSFGIAAVEGRGMETEEDDETVATAAARTRGSSASSSVAAQGGWGRWRGSDATTALPSLGAVEASRRPSVLATGIGLGVGGFSSPTSSNSTSAALRKGSTSSSSRMRMTSSTGSDDSRAPTSRTRPPSSGSATSSRFERVEEEYRAESEAAGVEAKARGFPPPVLGYQFPSPVARPRDSQVATAEQATSEAMGPAESPQQLFRHLASTSKAPSVATPTIAAPSSSLSARKGNGLQLSLANYQPFSPSNHLTASPLLSDPVSPTSVIPDPMAALTFPSSSPPKSGQTKSLHVNGSATSPRTHLDPPPTSQVMSMSSSTDSSMSFHSAGASSYHSPVMMRRDLSNSSLAHDPFPTQPRVPRLPADQLPSNRILAKLDSIFGDEALASTDPSPLDLPPRKLLRQASVLQVVNANTVKDRHLFLFNDMLVIAKPLVQHDADTGDPVLPSLDSHFLTKSVVECKGLRIAASEEPVDKEGSSSSSKKRHPLLLAFVDRFANDPARAIASLVQKGGLANDGPTIANLLFRNTDLNRNQLGVYLANPNHRSVLRAYTERFRFAGVRIDDAIRLFLMSVRLPYDVKAAEHMLGVVASIWAEANPASGFDPAVTLSLVMALLRLSDALHGTDGPDGRFFNVTKPQTPPNVDQFIEAFREADPRSVVSEDLLSRVYTSVRRERIEHASDNSIFSMTPDIEANIEPAKLPTQLIHRVPSETFTITIPEPDPRFTIKLHGNDLQFDPPVLSFARSNKQSFRLTGTALGVRVMVLIKRGANAPRYQGLPLNKAFSIERAFMQHTFQLSFTNHLDVKRKYMFSCTSAEERSHWIRILHGRIADTADAPSGPRDTATTAAQTVAVQVLRDSLLPPDEPLPLPPAAPSPRPNLAAPRLGPPGTPGTSRGRVGTPTRPGSQLARSNSVSKLYALQYRQETDSSPGLSPLGYGGGSFSGSAGERQRVGSLTPVAAAAAAAAKMQAAAQLKDEVAEAKAQHGSFVKTGHELVTTTEQNSLLPVVLAFLSAGLEAAPHPLSLQGSAFQLPPLPSPTSDYPPHPFPSLFATTSSAP
ncbi:ARF guanyl-nucleotide exchange factor [Rhodotorula toruloides]|uniref:ARF guanyl-nucleotide exchange factor n=1 Tax=Rhodotorula toruloides TaxID=5286 RepID=A0A511KGE0_RHOTO|nr:ARF guanyl-nucleotide exchange factor [Rhodotorula toruloides]